MTLYDFAANAAIGFWSYGGYGVADPEDAFELAVDSPIFAPTEEFLKWEIKSSDKRSPTIKTIRLYQCFCGSTRAIRTKRHFWRPTGCGLSSGCKGVGGRRLALLRRPLSATSTAGRTANISAQAARFVYAALG